MIRRTERTKGHAQAGCMCVRAGQETVTRMPRRRELGDARHPKKNLDGGKLL